MASCTESSVLRVRPSLSYSLSGTSATLRVAGRLLRYDGRATGLLPRLLPLLNGTRSLEAVIDELDAGQNRSALVQLCQRLVDDGLAVEVAEGDPPNDTVGMLSDVLRGTRPGLQDHRLSTLWVVGDSGEVAAIARLVPARWDVQDVALADLLESPGQADECAVVWVRDANVPLLAQWNESAYHNRRAWLPISHFDGDVAVVGPYVQPPESPCFECYRRRRAARSPLGETFLEMRQVEAAALTSGALTQVLAGIAVVLLEDWAARSNPHIPGAVRTVTFDEGLKLSTEYVLRVPRCAACRPTTNVARPTLWSEYFELPETT